MKSERLFIMAVLVWVGASVLVTSDNNLDFGPAFDNHPAGATDLVPRSPSQDTRLNIDTYMRPQVMRQVISVQVGPVYDADRSSMTESVSRPPSVQFQDLEERVKWL